MILLDGDWIFGEETHRFLLREDIYLQLSYRFVLIFFSSKGTGGINRSFIIGTLIQIGHAITSGQQGVIPKGVKPSSVRKWAHHTPPYSTYNRGEMTPVGALCWVPLPGCLNSILNDWFRCPLCKQVLGHLPSSLPKKTGYGKVQNSFAQSLRIQTIRPLPKNRRIEGRKIPITRSIGLLGKSRNLRTYLDP